MDIQLRSEMPGDEDAIDEDVLRIGNATQHMLTMLDELLELSRIGRMVNPPEDVALVDMVAEAIELSQGQIKQRNVTLQIVTELPVVYCDRQRIIEVLKNLVDDSIKYFGDQLEPKIEIGAELQHGETICYIRDNGMGIDPLYREKVFDLFQQLDSSSEGSGIGLALARRIVQFHGGRMWVESSGASKGTTVYFTIPNLCESDEAECETCLSTA